jgi:hypothetical protein
MQVETPNHEGRLLFVRHLPGAWQQNRGLLKRKKKGPLESPSKSYMQHDATRPRFSVIVIITIIHPARAICPL